MEDLIAGALILLAGMLIGRGWPGRRRKPDPGPKPVCGCRHNASFHDPLTGQCHATVKGTATSFIGGSPVTWEQVQCPCRKYTGPEPLPTVYAQEIQS